MQFGADVDPNTRQNIITNMYAQVARDFPNCPRPIEITIPEILFYYDLLVPELIEHQRKKNG